MDIPLRIEHLNRHELIKAQAIMEEIIGMIFCLHDGFFYYEVQYWPSGQVHDVYIHIGWVQVWDCSKVYQFKVPVFSSFSSLIANVHINLN